MGSWGHLGYKGGGEGSRMRTKANELILALNIVLQIHKNTSNISSEKTHNNKVIRNTTTTAKLN